MEEIFEKDDPIGQLVREEGLLKTSPGFTARVMNLVNESPEKVEASYKPLLSKGTWISIIFGFIALALISRFVINPNEAGEIKFFDRFKPVSDFVNGIHLSFDIAPNALMLATLIIASVALLLFLDYIVNKRISEN